MWKAVLQQARGGDLICSSSNEIKAHSLLPSPWTWVECVLQIDTLELLNTSHCVLFFCLSVQPTWDSGEESALKKYIYCKTIYAVLVQISSAEKPWNRKAAGLLRFHLSSIFAHPSCQPKHTVFSVSPVFPLILSLLYSVSFPRRYRGMGLWEQEATAPSCPGIPQIKTCEKKLLKLHTL